MRDDDTFGGRAARYARVSRAVGGLVARIAGQRYLGIGLDKERHAEDLKLALGGLKGPLMKVAQIMSTVPDMLPEEYIKELAQLQSNAPAMGWLFVRRRMSSELGPNWQQRFQAFEKTAAAAASLGQVHKATSLEGLELACKLQYPDMKSAVEADLKQLRVIFSLYHRYDKALNPHELHKEISDRLREELDYELERGHLLLYREILQNETEVHVPEPVPELSTDRLLTMAWLEGAPLLDKISAPAGTRNKIAANMFRAWYVPFYFYGTIHGDPHLGNYSVRENASINLMDFGCIRIFRPKFVKGVIDLYQALQDNDKAKAVYAYETWGFTELSVELIETLNLWAEFVYGPLLQDRVRKIQETDGTVYGAKIANQVHNKLRSLGGVTPPREFLLMDRAAVGLGSVFLHLRAEINWHRLFQELIGDFDIDTLQKRQGNALKKAGISFPD